ncbi:MAG: hypothetical protein HY694_12625 [Deltaproteobacteria bacterium]|nr:hypothetical protein [Deltaproteobacteria bacterium]
MRSTAPRNGTLPLARKLLDSAVWEQGSLAVQLWVWMLMTAVFSEDGFTMDNGVRLGRGQLWTTHPLMQKALRYRWAKGFKDPPLSTIKEIVQRWVKDGRIEKRVLVDRLIDPLTNSLVDRRSMIITICRYGDYNSHENIGRPIESPLADRLDAQEEKGIEEEKMNGTTRPRRQRSDPYLAAMAELWGKLATDRVSYGNVNRWRKQYGEAFVLEVMRSLVEGGRRPTGAVVPYLDTCLANEHARRKAAQSAAPRRIDYKVFDGLTVKPITDPQQRLEAIRKKWPDATTDPDQGFPFTLPDEVFVQPKGV